MFLLLLIRKVLITLIAQDLRKIGSHAKIDGYSRRERNELRYYEQKTARKRVNCVSPIAIS